MRVCEYCNHGKVDPDSYDPTEQIVHWDYTCGMCDGTGFIPDPEEEPEVVYDPEKIDFEP